MHLAQHPSHEFLARSARLRAAGFSGRFTAGGQCPTLAWRESLDPARLGVPGAKHQRSRRPARSVTSTGCGRARARPPPPRSTSRGSTVVPQAELRALVTERRTLTEGVGSFTWDVDHLRDVDPNEVDPVVAARRKALAAARS